MDAVEICPLSEEAVAKLLASRQTDQRAGSTNGRRQGPRWPFPGTVELWIPDENGVEQHTLATSVNLSLHGVGVKTEQELPEGLEVAIAIHEPEMSFHGRAVVRHCTAIDDGYYIGMQFIFEDE